MLELFGHSFGVFGILGLTIILYGVVARLVWHAGLSMGKLWYLPDKGFCEAVAKNISKWVTKAKELVSYKPQVTPRGFFLTPIWCSIICLNVLLLAQVLEVFLNGGKRMTLPWVGTYTAFPLFLGILYAVSETLLGVLRDAFKSKLLRVLLVLLMLSMFVVEAGLAYYRAWLLTSGEEMISPTMWDTVIFKVGPFLAAGIAFAVASVETLAGYFSFREFIEPMVPAVVNWFGGIVMWIWCGIAYLLFGFHRPNGNNIPVVPTSLVVLRRETNDLEARVLKLEREVLELRNKSQNLPPAPKAVEVLWDEWKIFIEGCDITRIKTDVEQQTKQLREKIERVKKLKDLRLVKIQLSRFINETGRDMNEIHIKASRHRDNVKGAPKSFSNRQDAIIEFNNRLNFTRSEYKELSRNHDKKEDCLLYYDAEQLQNLAQEGYNYQACDRIVYTAQSTLKTAKENLAGIEKDLGSLCELSPEDFNMENCDDLETDILLFLTGNLPSIKNVVFEPKSAYKWKRFHLMLPWNWFDGNGDHKNQPPDAPSDEQKETPDREEVAR